MDNNQEESERVRKIRKGFHIAFVIELILGGIILLIFIIAINSRGTTELVSVAGGLLIAIVILLPLTFAIKCIWECTDGELVAKRNAEAKAATEAIMKEIEREVEYDTVINPIVKTYIIGTQQETVEAKYMAIGGYGQLNRTVADTTTFLCVRKDGERETKKVLNGSEEYNKYIKLLDLTNPNINISQQ